MRNIKSTSCWKWNHYEALMEQQRKEENNEETNQMPNDECQSNEKLWMSRNKKKKTRISLRTISDRPRIIMSSARIPHTPKTIKNENLLCPSIYGFSFSILFFRFSLHFWLYEAHCFGHWRKCLHRMSIKWVKP